MTEVKRRDIKLTPQAVEKYRKDFPLYCKDQLMIVNKDAETVPLKLNRFQKFLWKQVREDIEASNPTRIYLLKARQLGSSTFVAALQHWRTVLWPNSNGLVVAHDLDTAEALFRKQKVFYGLLPSAWKPAQKLSNRRELDFSKNETEEAQPYEIQLNVPDIGLQSRLQVQTAKDVHLGAGMTLHSLHLSEFARYESVQQNVKLAMVSLMQTVPNRGNTFVFLETTAWGLNFSYDLWKDDNDWKKIFVSWIADPSYTSDSPLAESELEGASETKYGNERGLLPIIESDLELWYPELYSGEDRSDIRRTEALARLAWRRGKIDLDLMSDKNLFAQEFPTTAEEAFLTSGTNVFNTRKLADYRHAIEADDSGGSRPRYLRYHKTDREFSPAQYGDLRVYEEPEHDGRYVIGADVGEGLSESDYSAATVLSVPRMKQVAVYQSRIDPAHFGDALYALGKMYTPTRPALIGVEVNGPGFATNLRLGQQLFYPRLYTRETLDSKSRKWQKRFGWHTNRGSKTVMVSDLRKAIEEDLIRLTDLPTIDELGWYIQHEKSGKLEAAAGYNDDLVMALAIAVQMFMAGNFGEIKVKDPVPYKGTWMWYSDQMAREEDMKNRMGW